MSNSNRSYLHPGDLKTSSPSLSASSPAAGGDVITEQHGVDERRQGLLWGTNGLDPEWSSFAKLLTYNMWCNCCEQSGTTATENLYRLIVRDRPFIPPDVIVTLRPASENESVYHLITQTQRVIAVVNSDKYRLHGGDL